MFFNVTVNGGYSTWRDLTSCTVTCGGGTLQQQRDCNNPSPQFGGLTCAQQPLLGSATKSVSCNTNPCPGNK